MLFRVLAGTGGLCISAQRGALPGLGFGRPIAKTQGQIEAARLSQLVTHRREGHSASVRGLQNKGRFQFASHSNIIYFSCLGYITRQLKRVASLLRNSPKYGGNFMPTHTNICEGQPTLMLTAQGAVSRMPLTVGR